MSVRRSSATSWSDVIAYITATAKDPGGDSAQVVPGTPERGEKLFRDKQCAACHTIGGRAVVGPELGRAHHVSLTQFAGLMWNHGPAMWARMKERRIDVPESHRAGDGGHRRPSLHSRITSTRPRGTAPAVSMCCRATGCVARHSVRGKGGKVAGDLSTSGVVGSPSALIAAMWNHSRAMEDQAQKQGVKLQTIKGQEPQIWRRI